MVTTKVGSNDVIVMSSRGNSRIHVIQHYIAITKVPFRLCIAVVKTSPVFLSWLKHGSNINLLHSIYIRVTFTCVYL